MLATPREYPFRMRKDHTVPQRVKAIPPAQNGKEFDRRFIGSLCHRFCSGQVSANESEARPAGVCDAGRFAHFDSDVGVVGTLAAGTGAAMPTAVIPGEGLIHVPGAAVNKGMHTGALITGVIPFPDEYRSGRLGTPHRMKHQPLYGNVRPAA